MTRDVLLDLLKREPFKPMTLTLSNNDRVLITDPAAAEVGRNFITVPGDPAPVKRTITLHHVLAVDCENAPTMLDH